MSDPATTEASRTLIRRMYESAMAGDLAGVFAMMSPDVVVYEPSYLSYGGVWRGRDGFKALFAEVAKFIALDTLRVAEVIADGNVVMAVVHARSAGSGEDLVLAERSEIRDGFVTEMRIFYHEGGDLFPRAPR